MRGLAVHRGTGQRDGQQATLTKAPRRHPQGGLHWACCGNTISLKKAGLPFCLVDEQTARQRPCRAMFNWYT